MFEPQEPLSRFTIRGYEDYADYQFKYERSFINRVNGELCTYNTIKIIERYRPDVYIIENPATSRMWEYIEEIIGFDIPYENLTYYSNYDYPLMKPTKFKSNIDLKLDDTRTIGDIPFKKFSKDYNERSNIPKKLVETIFNRVLKA